MIDTNQIGKKIFREIPLTCYPLCQYAAIVNLPDDIKPDWLIAARKAFESSKVLNLAAEDFKEEHDKWMKIAEKRIILLEVFMQKYYREK